MNVFLFNPGTQEAIAMCLHVETKQAVNETLCDNSKRPPPMTRACNIKLCPPRYTVIIKLTISLPQHNLNIHWFSQKRSRLQDCDLVLGWNFTTSVFNKIFGLCLMMDCDFFFLHSFSTLYISLIKQGNLFCVDVLQSWKNSLNCLKIFTKNQSIFTFNSYWIKKYTEIMI